MPTLYIDLRTGFDSDAVELRVNERSYSRTKVTTDYSIGLAERIEARLPAGRISVVINLPDKNLSKKIELDLNSDMHLGVSCKQDEIQHEVSAEPFAYY